LVFMFFSTLAWGQDWSDTYTGLMQDGGSADSAYKYDEATSSYQEAFDMALQHGDSVLALNALFENASSTFLSGNIDAAFNLYKLGLSEFYQIASATQKGVLYQQIALMHGQSGDRDSSSIYLQKGLTALSPEEDSLTYAFLYDELSNANVALGNYQLSYNYADSALKYLPKSELKQIGRSYISKYLALLWLGRSQEAEPILMESLAIAEELNNLALLTEVYRFAGDFFAKRNDLNKALIYFQQGLRYSEHINDPRYIHRYHQALGDLFIKLESPDRAIPHLNAAHQYYELQKNELVASDLKVKLGISFLEKGDVDEAESLLKQAYTTLDELQNIPRLSAAIRTLLRVYLQKNDVEEAQKYLQEIRELAVGSDRYQVRLDSYRLALDFDDEYVSLNEKKRTALAYFNETKNQEPIVQLRAQTSLARIYYQTGSDSSFILAEKSFEEIEKRRISLSGGVLKATAFSEFSTFYNEVGSWYAQRKMDYSHAFDLFEKSKARSLLDQLAEITNDNGIVSEEEEIRLLELQKRIDQLHRQKEQTESIEENIELDQQISSYQLEYDALLEQIKADNPAWSTFAYPEVLTLKEVKALLDKETAIVEFAYTYKGLAILLITEHKTHFHLVDGDTEVRKMLKTQIDNYRSLIINQASTEELRAASDELVEIILKPVLPGLDAITNLVIVPDGELNLLPFDALLIDGTYLVQQYAIKMMPSVSVFNLLPEPHRVTEDNFFAVAGSGFEAGDGLFGTNAQTAFATLPYALIEVDSIATHFELPKVLKNEQVTEAAIKKLNLSEFKFLHFATHGAINESEPTQSGLILSKKIQMESLFGEDGYLNSNEIARLQLNADLVVLSSCNTATGKVLSGEGLLGLQRSFLTAGASSVVASLWSIYDRSTPVFMSHFYQYLIDFEHQELGWYDRLLIKLDWYEPELIDYKTLALQQAKLDMMEHPYYNHPVHWASFVLVGK
jgi:CHAT domain-containing protein